jgi:hypothetical protein
VSSNDTTFAISSVPVRLGGDAHSIGAVGLAGSYFRLSACEISLRHCEVVAGAGMLEYFDGVAKGRDRLFQSRGAALALAEGSERSAKIVLGHRPIERHALARCFLQGVAKGRDRLL